MSSSLVRQENFLQNLWRPAAAGYLLVCVISLAVGLFGGVIIPRPEGIPATLQAVEAYGVGQVVFFLLIYPVIFLSRSQHDIRQNSTLLPSLFECLILQLASIPFLIACAYLSDATAQDALRMMMLNLSWIPVSLALGIWLTIPWARAAICSCMVWFVLALPAIYYISLDFLVGIDAKWLWNIAPVTFAWENASSNIDSWIVRPLWVQFAWITLAACGFTSYWLLSQGSRRNK